MHENIRVFRHPDHARIGVFFWAHHEKIVAVDQKYAFVGGLDLCYGRWDDYQHRMTDLGGLASSSTASSSSSSSSAKRECPKGRSATQQWSLPDVAARQEPQQPQQSNVAAAAMVANQQPHVQMRLDEPDAAQRPQLEAGDRLIISPTSTATAATATTTTTAATGSEVAPSTPLPENTKRNTPEMERKHMFSHLKENIKERGKELIARITTTDTGSSISSPDDPSADAKSLPPVPALHDFVDPVPFRTATLNGEQAKYWMGKDYVNFIIKDLVNLDAPFADSVNRQVTPRLPWHDVGAMVAGASARDVARHFIQRWNAIKLEKARDNVVSARWGWGEWSVVVLNWGFMNAC